MRFRDPVTGDPLTLGEEVAWKVQGVIRRWTWLIGLIVATAWVWWHFAGDPAVLGWWNLGASLGALLIEGMVGIAMFSQTRRDAQVLRRIDRLEELHGQLLEEIRNAIGGKA